MKIEIELGVGHPSYCRIYDNKTDEVKICQFLMTSMKYSYCRFFLTESDNWKTQKGEITPLMITNASGGYHIKRCDQCLALEKESKND